MNSIEYKTPKPEHGITMTRLLDAPVALVFKAWTDPARLAQWWGPHGFTTPVCVLEARAGGALHIVMRGPDGTDLPIRGEVIEVEPDRLLVYAMRADNSRGAWGTEGVPRDAVHSIRFAPEAGKTRLTITVHLGSTADRDFMRDQGLEHGFGQSLERMADLLRG
jgi:uncharacterized protein YndB with AHSA1/START domain